jgi:hypothetical protein
MPLTFRLVLVCCAGFSVTGWCQEKATNVDALEKFEQIADDYHLAVDSSAEERELKREAKPLQRWTNPVRDSNQGVTLLWTDNGRPQAIACLYSYGADGLSIDHEFQSLATEPLRATYQGKRVWEPQPAMKWKIVPAADQPADKATARLIQMRSIARRFDALVDQKQDPHELRLLPQPLYRYAAADDGIRDGALLAFVQATDPELLLLLEARQTEKGDQWHYALARVTDLALKVKLDEDEVWSAEPWDWRTRHPSQSYIKFTSSLKQ